jgi:outer membrane immunogenic protein
MGVAIVAHPWGLTMQHFRFSVFVIALSVVAGVLLSATGAFAQCIPASGANSDRGSGFIAGGHGGYDWQQGPWVYGLAADLSASGLRSSMSGGLTVGFGCPTDAASTSAKIDWYGTVRGRIGWSGGNVLLYGTGGFAYGDVNLTSSYTAGLTTTTASVSQIKTGFVVGGGLDYVLQPQLVFNLSYQYVDLGTLSLASANLQATQTASAQARFHALMAGLSWRFGPGGGAPRPGSWEGFNVGAHGGGAWGLNTNAVYTLGPAPSDMRLKRDIALVGYLDNGLGLYRYRYLWDDTIYVGVMAQEVAQLAPQAVLLGSDGYLRVDYAQLGLRMQTWERWSAAH